MILKSMSTKTTFLLIFILLFFFSSCIHIGNNVFINPKNNIELNKIYHEAKLNVRKNGSGNTTECQAIANQVINKLYKIGYKKHNLYWISGKNNIKKNYHRAIVVKTNNGFKLIDWPEVSVLKNNNNILELTWWQVKRMDKITMSWKNCKVEDGKLIILEK